MAVKNKKSGTDAHYAKLVGRAAAHRSNGAKNSGILSKSGAGQKMDSGSTRKNTAGCTKTAPSGILDYALGQKSAVSGSKGAGKSAAAVASYMKGK